VIDLVGNYAQAMIGAMKKECSINVRWVGKENEGWWWLFRARHEWLRETCDN